MRFLVDECCPRAFVDALRLSGHDVLYAAETATSASDEELAATAAAEDRLIVTQDYDFGELAVRRRLPVSGVLLIACQGQPPAQRAERLRQIVDDLQNRLIGAL